MPPATRPTGRVMAPVAVEASVKPKSVTKTVGSKDKDKERKKSHKSRKTGDPTDKDHKPDKNTGKKHDSKSHKKRGRSTSPVPKHSSKQERSGSALAVSSPGPESDKQLELKKVHMHQPSGSEKTSTGHTGQSSSVSQQPDYGHFSTGARVYPPDTEDTLFEQLSDEELDRSESPSGSEDGQLSDSTETPEQTEDMTYRETVRSVRSFMG